MAKFPTRSNKGSKSTTTKDTTSKEETNYRYTFVGRALPTSSDKHLSVVIDEEIPKGTRLLMSENRDHDANANDGRQTILNNLLLDTEADTENK